MAPLPVDTDLEAGEQTPLVPKIYNEESQGETPPSEDDEASVDSNDPPPLKDIKTNTLKEQLVAGVAATTFGTSLLAMVVESNPSVYVSGTVGALVAPVSYIQQQKITQTEALKETNERLTLEVDNLHHENERLSATVGELESSVNHLQELQDTLSVIQATESGSIDELEHQLEDSKKIYSKMQGNLQGDILNNLITILLNVDKDGDFMLHDEEIDDLIVHLEGLKGVNIHNKALKEFIISHGRSVDAIMDVARTFLTHEELSEQDKHEKLLEFVHQEEEEEEGKE